MRTTAPSPSVPRGGFRAGLILLAFVIALVLGGARASDAAVGVEAFAVATAQEDETSVAVSGNVAVWKISRSSTGLDIQGKNLATGQDLALPAEPGAQRHPSVDGRTVVWESRSSGDSDVYGYDLVTREKFPVAVGPGEQTEPVVDGKYVVWQDDRSGDSNIYAYDLDAGEEIPVSTDPGGQFSPAVSATTVVWEDRDAVNSDVVFRDLQTGAQRTLSGPGWQEDPAIGGDTVVWREDGVLNSDINGYDLEKEDGITVASGPGDQFSPVVDGRVVTWTEEQGGGGADVRGKDLTTGETFLTAGGPADQQNPDVSGERVIWEAQRTGEDNFGTYDLRGARLDLAPLAPAGLAARGSAGGVALDWNRSPEVDFAGYNVYRAASENGEYTKLNANLLSASSLEDAQAPKGTRSFYRVTAVDAAGSESAAARASAVAPAETGLSLSANLSQTGFGGGTVALSGRLSSGADGLPNETVALERRPEGTTAWSPVPGGPATTAPDGGYSLAVLDVDRDTDYRAVFGGTEVALPSTSTTATVDVATTISLGTARTVRLGRFVTISGLVLPNKTGEVDLTIKRGGATVDRQTVRVNNNAFSARYKPRAVGSYQVVAQLAGDAETTSTAGFAVKRVIRR